MATRSWLSALVFSLALPLSGCSSDAAGTPSVSVQYLALGDSIAYGENGFVPYTKVARPNGDAFVGYPNLLGKELFAGHYANLGCPGATTGSFSSADAMDNGCRSFQRDWLDTLHVQYTSTEADKAKEVISMNDVHVITLGLGGNDLLLTLAGCTALTPDDPKAALTCALQRLPQTLTDGADNVTKIIQQLHDEGFKGKLIYVNLYSTYAASDKATLAVNFWNARIAPVITDAGGTVADVYTAFSDAAQGSSDPCAAGLLIPNPDPNGTPACDVHPSEKGARLLADTVKATPGFAP